MTTTAHPLRRSTKRSRVEELVVDEVFNKPGRR